MTPGVRSRAVSAEEAKSDAAKPIPPRERVELILNQIDQLPTLPVVAAQLLAATTSDDSCADDVVEIIEADASLTAAILKLVRRADLGVQSRGITVKRAVTLVGFNAVRNAALSVQLYEVFGRSSDDERAARMRTGLWHHSLAVACMSELIAERIGRRELVGDAFVCGLLHDIGKIALDACLPKSYARVAERVERQHACICDVEHEVFGLDHTVAGKRLVSRWRLAPAIVESVWLHHQDPSGLPSSVTHPDLVRVVHLADNLIRCEGIGFSGYQYIADVVAVAAAVGLDEAALADLRSRLLARMEPYEEIMGVTQAGTEADYTASIVAANRQLGQLNARLSSENRTLDVRSSCLTAVNRILKRWCDCDTVGDVCAASAESVRQLVAGDCTVAAYGERVHRRFHAACSPPPGEDQRIALVDLGDATVAEHLACVLPERNGAGLSLAPPECDALWQRLAGRPPDDCLWILPVPVGETGIGAILVAAAERNVRRFTEAPEEMQILATSVALAINAARAREHGERDQEELFDLNRRLKEAQAAIVRQRSVSMIAAMAAGAAHELNNPLSVVSGRAQMELERCADESLARTLRIITEQTAKATEIVNDLMQFAKPERPEPSTQRLQDVLHRLRQHWQAEYGLRVDQLTVKIDDDDATVYADAGQLSAILSALVANAVQAAGRETAHVQINSPSHPSDETVRIVVEDNGVGMTRDVLDHAIDPFFSSRPAGRGRGLGLSRAYRFAEINGGTLWLESTPEVGTSVHLQLPARPRRTTSD